ncbi:MAG: HEAT repeat domain-containing protein [Phycisphaerales bacterium]|nr:HEAT repeat domain-containing protein [Phycisphaerales bacterium]
MHHFRLFRLLKWLGAMCLAAVFAAEAPAQLTEAQQADLAIWRTVLSDAPGDPAVQRSAARRLLESGWQESLSLLGEMLGEFRRPELVSVICASIRDMDNPPEALFDALVERLAAAPPELQGHLADAIGTYPPTMLPRLIARLDAQGALPAERVALIGALSRFTEVEVVDSLIHCLEPQDDPAVRAAAVEALARVTGADYGDSMTRWQSWWRNNRLQGRDGLVRRKLLRLERERNEAILRAQSLQRDVAALTSELLTAINRNYTLTEPDQRNALLLTLLQHPRVPVRRLGLDLVEQRVLNAEPLSPEVPAMLARMVADAAGPLRAPALRRLALVDAAGASALVGAMLADTTDAELEAAMLAVLAQTADARAAPAIVARFIRPERPKGTASALLAAAQARHLDAELWEEVWQQLRAQDHAALTAVEAEVLAWCPQPEAADLLLAILQPADGGAERRAAAARGLAASGLHRDVLLAHAGDPLVYAHALRSAARTGGLDSLRLMLSWPVLDAARFGEEIGQVLTGLPPSDWLEADNLLAANEAVDVQRRFTSLSRVLTLPQSNNGSNGAAALSADARRRICLRLAELHWQRAEPEAMLTALQAAPPGESDVEREAALRTIALVALERFDAADARRAADWVDALDLVLRQRTTDVDRARRIAEAIQQGRAGTLSESDQLRFDSLMVRLASLITSEPPGG